MLHSQILLPSEPLRPFVHHYWIMRADRNSIAMNILPTGCTKWMFHWAKPFCINGFQDINNRASLCGQYQTAAQVVMQGEADLLFVFFRPYAMKMITGIPCDLFANSNIALDDLGIPEFKWLKQQILETTNQLTAIRLIEEFIIRQLTRRSDDVHLKQFMEVCHTIELYPNASLSYLAEKACLSERQLRRLFLNYIGMPPKHLMRIQRCLVASQSILQTSERDFSSLIYQLGFTDHSHFYKEFKLFAGMSPSNFLDHISNIRGNDLIRGYQAYHKQGR